MKLFPQFIAPTNILPNDGEAIYFGPIINESVADEFLFHFQHEVLWSHDNGVMYEQPYASKRKISFYDEEEMASIPGLSSVKEFVEDKAHTQFNSCLFNLYENGDIGVSWHFDKEARHRSHCNIASFTLGAERRFDFRHIRTNKTVSIVLEHGSLLLMRGTTQLFWRHQLPKTKAVRAPRINITFRQI